MNICFKIPYEEIDLYLSFKLILPEPAKTFLSMRNPGRNGQ